MEHIIIGEIIKAQGIKGEVKVKPLTDDAARFKMLKIVYLDGKPFKILSARADSSYAYIGFVGVDDRDKAELLRGKKITIERVNAVVLPDDAFFISDIVGCKLLSEGGNIIGKIVEVSQHGAADVFVVKCEDKRILRFPFLKKVFSEMDIAGKALKVVDKELNGVCVYDD